MVQHAIRAQSAGIGQLLVSREAGVTVHGRVNMVMN